MSGWWLLLIIPLVAVVSVTSAYTMSTGTLPRWRRKRKRARLDRSLHTLDDEGYAPLPIDPANPPTIRYYRPKKSNANARRTCHCHGKTIEVDQEIVWWPLPDGSVRLLCKDAEMKGIVKEESA